MWRQNSCNPQYCWRIHQQQLEQAICKTMGRRGLMAHHPCAKTDHRRNSYLLFKTILQTPPTSPSWSTTIPLDYKTDVTLDMFAELVCLQQYYHRSEKVQGCYQCNQAEKNRFGSRLKILCGVDTLSVEELLLGSGWPGGRTGMCFPAETVVLYKLVKAGRLDEASSDLPAGLCHCWNLTFIPNWYNTSKLAETQTGIGSSMWGAPV